MPAARLAPDDVGRLAALRALEIFDTEISPELDIYLDPAREVFDAPTLAISLLEHDRQYLKASVWLGIGEMPRDVSFSPPTILKPGGVPCVEYDTNGSSFTDKWVKTGKVDLSVCAGARSGANSR